MSTIYQFNELAIINQIKYGMIQSILPQPDVMRV